MNIIYKLLLITFDFTETGQSCLTKDILSNKPSRKIDRNVTDLSASRLFGDHDIECDYKNAGMKIFCSLIL